MKINSIKFKLIALIATSLIIGALVIVAILNKSYNDNIKNIAEQAIKTSQASYNNLEKNDVYALSVLSESIMANKELKEAFTQRDREELFKLGKPIMKNLKEKYGITHWYYINDESDRTAFARINKPADFGDEMKRTVYTRSIESKKIEPGKELGKTTFALRIARPYYDGEKLLGYLMMGKEIDNFISEMKKQTGDDFALVLKKKYVDEKEWAKVKDAHKQRNNWKDHKDIVVVEKTTKDDSIINFTGDVEQIPANGMVVEEFKKDNSMFIRGIFPLYDAAGKKVGGVFVIRDITQLYNGMKTAQQNVIISTIILMFVVFITMIIMVNRIVIKRMDKIIDTATVVVGGDYNSDIAVTSDDEVGKIENLFEQFRKVFVYVLGELEQKNEQDSNKDERKEE